MRETQNRNYNHASQEEKVRESVKHGVQNIGIEPEMFGWHLHRLLIARLVSNEEFYPGRKMSAFYQTGYQS